MGKQRKGGAYERELCKQLSLWWTNGKRTDVFWRTAGSGARATVRSRCRQDTFGSYGDIMAIDPIGQPLIDCFTIEVKRGYSSHTFADLITPGKAKPMYEQWIDKVLKTYKASGSWTWALIHKRDHRLPVVMLPYGSFSYFDLEASIEPISIIHTMQISIACCRLEDFLQGVEPDMIKEASNKC